MLGWGGGGGEMWGEGGAMSRACVVLLHGQVQSQTYVTWDEAMEEEKAVEELELEFSG